MGLMTYQQGHNRDITHTDRIPSPWSPVAHPLSFWLVEQLVGFMLSLCPRNGRVVVRLMG
jgi:hypothetical protein